MSDVVIVQPDSDEACCCCSADNVLLHKWTTEPFEGGKEHQHCDFCYETFAGNTCVYPNAYDRETAQIMQHINNVANLLLKRISGS